MPQKLEHDTVTWADVMAGFQDRTLRGLRRGSTSNPGQVRTQNEDCLHSGEWLLVVADGMGGHQAGEVASEITVSTIRNACSPAPIGADDSNLAHLRLSDLVKAVVDANSAIFRAPLEDLDTPFALGLVTVGDSRTYVMRQARLRQVSEDHSFTRCLREAEFLDRQQTKSLSISFSSSATCRQRNLICGLCE